MEMNLVRQLYKYPLSLQQEAECLFYRRLNTEVRALWVYKQSQCPPLHSNAQFSVWTFFWLLMPSWILHVTCNLSPQASFLPLKKYYRRSHGWTSRPYSWISTKKKKKHISKNYHVPSFLSLGDCTSGMKNLKHFANFKKSFTDKEGSRKFFHTKIHKFMEICVSWSYKGMF